MSNETGVPWNFPCRFISHCCPASTASTFARATQVKSENLLDGRAACPIPQHGERKPPRLLAFISQSHENRFPVSRLRVGLPTNGEVADALWRRRNCAEISTGLGRRQCYVLGERLPSDASGVEYHFGRTSEAGGMRHGGERTATY